MAPKNKSNSEEQTYVALAKVLVQNQEQDKPNVELVVEQDFKLFDKALSWFNKFVETVMAPALSFEILAPHAGAKEL